MKSNPNKSAVAFTFPLSATCAGAAEAGTFVGTSAGASAGADAGAGAGSAAGVSSVAGAGAGADSEAAEACCLFLSSSACYETKHNSNLLFNLIAFHYNGKPNPIVKKI